MITVRRLAASALRRSAKIDRAEHVTQDRVYRRGALELLPVDVHRILAL